MKQVLITDDDISLLRAVQIALQDNYKVLPLSIHTEMSSHILKNDNPAELMILTVSKSNMDCFAVFEYVKQTPGWIDKPVIFLVEQQSSELEQRALLAGADDFIAMPCSSELLLHRVGRCIELHHLRKNRVYTEKYQDAISLSFAELVEFRDETTGGHLKNTTQYFNILLEEVMASDDYKDIIPVEDVRDLLRSAALHDIGKIGISDEILRKASPLDYHEYEYMKTHTTLGKQAFEKIIQETGGTRWLFLAKDIAYCHHERWDGTGYPNGLKGEEIPIYARIMTVADVYDALTSRRSYKHAYEHKYAVEIIIDGKGTIFDPNLVDLFINTNERFEEVLLNKENAHNQ